MAPANLLNDVPFCAVSKFTKHTVDGRNVAPVDGGFFLLFLGFQPSKVVQDFFHPQYHKTLSATWNIYYDIYEHSKS